MGLQTGSCVKGQWDGGSARSSALTAGEVEGRPKFTVRLAGGVTAGRAISAPQRVGAAGLLEAWVRASLCQAKTNTAPSGASCLAGVRNVKTSSAKLKQTRMCQEIQWKVTSMFNIQPMTSTKLHASVDFFRGHLFCLWGTSVDIVALGKCFV